MSASSTETRKTSRLYCPFCIFDFGFEFLLESHIKDVHSQEITFLTETDLKSIKTDTCLYCDAKFYIHGLLPKHVIRKHQECILTKFSTTTEDDSENINCNFCHYRVSSKQIKLLFIHLENKHLRIVDEILTNFDPLTSKEATKNLECLKQRNTIRTTERITLAEIVNSSHENRPRLKPILKRGTLKTDIFTSNEAATSSSPRPVKRRKLRFNLPDTSFSSVGSDKENLPVEIIAVDEKASSSISTIQKQRNTHSNLSSVHNRSEVRNVLGNITDIVNGAMVDALEATKPHHVIDLPFRCGICSIQFANNSILSHHVKKKHGRIHFHPPYRCGLCKAKFYRNSYLVKHHLSHGKSNYYSRYRYESLQDDTLRN